MSAKAIIKEAGDITNIRGRFKFSAALLSSELHRILNSKKFARNYGRAEWLNTTQGVVNSVELEDQDYYKLVLCLDDGSNVDISDRLKLSNSPVGCAKNKSLTITRNCGIILIKSEIGIKAVRSIYRLSDKENERWLMQDHKHVFVAYLRWQLLADIRADNANTAYADYIRLLQHLDNLEVMK